MVIDSHQHFWKYDPVRDSWITDEMQIIRKDFFPEDLKKIYEASGINGCISVQADESEKETEFLVELAGRYDFIKGVVGWIDLSKAGAEAKLQEWKKHTRLKGFRSVIQGRPDDLYFTNKQFREGIKKLAPLGYTYDILIYHYQMEAANRFLEHYPDQYFILDHLGKPNIRDGEIRKWKEQIRIMAEHPRVYCKLSGLVTEADWQRWRYEDLAPYMEIAAEYFGTGRLCFGSDWPVCLVASSYDKLTVTIKRFLQQVNEDERKRVWGLNAMEFYHL